MAAPIDLHHFAEREHEARSRDPVRVKGCNSTSCQSAGAAATSIPGSEALAQPDQSIAKLRQKRSTGQIHRVILAQLGAVELAGLQNRGIVDQ